MLEMLVFTYFLVMEFLTLKQDSMSVQEYGMNLTQLSHYVMETLSCKEARVAMFIGDMNLSRLMIYVQQV